MAFDFPASPAIDQDHVAGTVTYTYNGTGWVIKGTSATQFVARSGDVMTGHLGLPTGPSATQAVRKDYVDTADTTLTTAVGLKADKSYVDTQDALKADKTYVDTQDNAIKVYAAPFDAMAYNGMQINGNMAVSQEHGTDPKGANAYVTDGWRMESVGAQVVYASQATSLLSLGCVIGTGLPITVGTANAAPVSGNYVIALHKIEGYRVERLGWGTVDAQPITIGFWVRAVRTGMYSGAVRNAALNRSQAFTFTVNASSVFEYKTVTILGDTTGVWEKGNLAGMLINFAMMGNGSISGGIPGTWVAANRIGATGTTNGVAATSDIFMITGVIVIPGIYAPTAAQSPLIMRPYDQELVMCRRYYWKWKALIAGEPFSLAHMQTTTIAVGVVRFPVTMRATPTTAASGLWGFKHGGAMEAFNPSTNSAGPDTVQLEGTVPSHTQGDAGRIVAEDSSANFVADARL